MVVRHLEVGSEFLSVDQPAILVSGYPGLTRRIDHAWGRLRKATRFKTLDEAIVAALEHGGRPVKYNAAERTWSELQSSHDP